MPIGIALIEPKHSINVGYVARIMKNFGFSKLFTVDPSYDMVEAKKYAMHGYDLLEASTATSLRELRRNSRILVGTTAMKSSSRLNFMRHSISPAQLADIIYENPLEGNIHIVLGREASGLRNSELQMCDLVLTIETGTEYTTMNISHALAIILYEITKRNLQKSGSRTGTKNQVVACRSETDMLIAYSSKTAELAGYNMHKRPLLDSALRRLLGKSNPSSKEVMLMVSLFRKAIQKMECKRNFC
jgi:tRNA/rRNA methyltransferase